MIVLLVNAAEMFRIGVKLVIRSEYRDVRFLEAATSGDALRQLSASRSNPKLVFLDAEVSDGEPLLLRRVREFGNPPPVLITSQRGSLAVAAWAYRIGASGYVPKDVKRAELLKAIDRLLAGKKHFSASVLRAAERLPRGPRGRLSAQESKVMSALARGDRVGEIASAMNLSLKTISTYKRRIFNKTCVTSTADLVRYAIDQDLD